MLPNIQISSRSNTILTVGCWDPYHVGHLYHLQHARKLADTLIVAVTKNGYVHKGKDRPYGAIDDPYEDWNELERLYAEHDAEQAVVAGEGD